MRAPQSGLAPRTKYLVPYPIAIPTFGVDFDEGQLLIAGIVNGTARVSLPALTGAPLHHASLARRHGVR